MGICWGDPHNPTPTHAASLKSRMTLTTSSTPTSENNKTFPAHEQALEESRLRVFTFSRLMAATQGFSHRAFLGDGSFGNVYEGLIDENATRRRRKSMIVVKKLKQGGLQGFDKWQTEILFLGRLSHPNIAKLLGYCYKDEQLFLVYEFASNGSLNIQLYGRYSIAPPLQWDTRLNIAIGAARGLAFLHSCKEKIIHRDIRPANILLDESYNAKLSVFGLTRFDPSEGSHLSTTSVTRALDYAAPEYLKTGHLYKQSDVYGFGVVLLELLTGRQVIERNRPAQEQNLVTWSIKHLSSKENLVAMMDPKLKGKYSFDAAAKVAQLALKCVSAHQDQRPLMTEVVEELEKIEPTSAG